MKIGQNTKSSAVPQVNYLKYFLDSSFGNKSKKVNFTLKVKQVTTYKLNISRQTYECGL